MEIVGYNDVILFTSALLYFSSLNLVKFQDFVLLIFVLNFLFPNEGCTKSDKDLKIGFISCFVLYI